MPILYVEEDSPWKITVRDDSGNDVASLTVYDQDLGGTWKVTGCKDAGMSRGKPEFKPTGSPGQKRDVEIEIG